MSEDEIHHPHDKLFKLSFRDPQETADFLSRELPPHLSKQIDWTKMQLEEGSFIDSKFRESECDLLFSAPLGEHPCLIYFLFEHQKKDDKWIGARLLRYMAQIWATYLREQPKTDRLPVVLGIVLGQSKSTRLMAADFIKSFKLTSEQESDFAPYIPGFSYHLIHLADRPWQELKGTANIVYTLRLLQAFTLNRLLADYVWDETLMEQISPRLLEIGIHYILNGGIDILEFEHRMQLIHSAKLQETAMTAAQQLQERGRKRGRQEGRQEERREAILDILEIRFGKVPQKIRTKIRNLSDRERLLALQRVAVTCKELVEFEKEL